ncbi:MAG: hypothetical protein GY818_15970 [Planctomycetaceae bacterium]|nr:hypothetical protein [Planctomycetaceae bacterium]
MKNARLDGVVRDFEVRKLYELVGGYQLLNPNHAKLNKFFNTIESRIKAGPKDYPVKTVDIDAFRAITDWCLFGTQQGDSLAKQ